MTAAQAYSEDILRIIDANLNRIGEGLRLLEEIARMVLDDAGLTQRLKNLRHEVVRTDVPFQKELLKSRDADGDVGAAMDVPGEKKGRDLPAVLVANARRAQESLRVLEELAKTPESPEEIDSDTFRRARFSLYTIEQELMARLEEKDSGEIIIDIEESD